MNGIENAQFDLGDARCSLETAIELLGGISADNRQNDRELKELITHLGHIKEELDNSYRRLENLQYTE